MKKGITYTVIFMLIISFIFVFLLSAVNELTKERTQKNEELIKRKAVLNAFQISYSSNDKAYQLYDEELSTVEKDGTELYTYEQDGVVLYAVIFQDMALWGDVRGIIAVDKDVTTITGFDIISHNETPGLGGRIDEAAYKDQLIGEVVGPGGMIRETRTGSYDYDHTNGTIDSITGATRTSDSMVKIINNELSRLRDLLGVDE